MIQVGCYGSALRPEPLRIQEFIQRRNLRRKGVAAVDILAAVYHYQCQGRQCAQRLDVRQGIVVVYIDVAEKGKAGNCVQNRYLGIMEAYFCQSR